jgi:hypothetical protein
MSDPDFASDCALKHENAHDLCGKPLTPWRIMRYWVPLLWQMETTSVGVNHGEARAAR